MFTPQPEKHEESGYVSQHANDSHASDESDEENNKKCVRRVEGYSSDEEEEDSKRFSDPATPRGFVSPINPHGHAGTSSPTMCTKREEKNSRIDKTKLYNVTFSGHGNVRQILSCQSTGKETVLNMVKNRLQWHDRSLGFFLFKTVDNDCLNVGLPVGTLSEKENYECEVRTKSTLQATDCMREYAVNEYSCDWNTRHFFVSLSNIAAGVTSLKNRIRIDQNMRLRVDFFEHETIFEALVRDNRFIEQKLRFCEIICDRKPLEMCYDALHCQNKTVEICSLKPLKVVTGLPKSVLPRPHPALLHTSVKVENDEDSVVTAGSSTTEPSKAKNDEDSVVTAGPSTAVLPLDSSTPNSTASTSQANSDETFTHLIECAFKSEMLTPKHGKKLATECGKIFRNFALKQDWSIPAGQVRELTKTLDSVGAIFKLNCAGFPELIGTCF